jgi:acyl dehydratase
MAAKKENAMTTIEINQPKHAAQMYAGALMSSRKRPGVVKALKPVTYVRPAVKLDAAEIAAYAKVCGFKPEAGVPVLYPQMLTFPLAMEFFASEYCPWPAMGTVHLGNRIVQHKKLNVGDVLRVEMRTGELLAHEKGQIFTLEFAVSRDDELVWEGTMTALRIGVKNPVGKPYASALSADVDLSCQTTFSAPADMGRRYGLVSGDMNPIHLTAASAKLFGFRQAIAHGLWTKARALAAMLPRQPIEKAEVTVEFKTPLYLPGRASLWATRQVKGKQPHNAFFEVRNAKGDKPHLRAQLAYTVAA